MQFTVSVMAALRGKGWSEDQIAKRLGFEARYSNSPAKAMYTRFKDLGLPDWLVYPDMPLTEEEFEEKVGEPASSTNTEKTTEKSAKKPERKARAAGDSVTLPPVAEAEVLFRENIERLENYVNQMPRRWEYLQGERFASALLANDEAFDIEVFDRNMFFEYPDDKEEGVFLAEEWKRTCERYGAEPNVVEFVAVVESEAYPLGAGHLPREGLTELIAIDALLHKSPERLVDYLHPDPSSADREKIREFAEKMKVNAEKLAIKVRGGQVRRGHHPGEVSRREMWEAWRLINPLREDGFSDEQIITKLREQGFYCEGEYEPGEKGDYQALQEIRRIASLRLKTPRE